jgi:aminopeptidase
MSRQRWVGALAELAVFGANVQPGQIVSITSFTGKEELTRAATRAAYERGAKYVDVLYFDNWVKRERLALAAEASLDYIPPWLSQRLQHLSDERGAMIWLVGPHAPEALSGIDPVRAGRDLLPWLPELMDVVNQRTVNLCLIPAPTRPWAQAVYPDLEREEAYDRLWEAVAHICRLDTDDPQAAWNERIAALTDNAARLTNRDFDALRLHGPGTDLTIGLLPSSTWQPAVFTTVDGVRHYPDLPTEEVLSTPDPERVDGYVTATMPLELQGNLISGIRVEFEGGRAVKIDADRGADILRATAAKDEGAARLGEIALVDREGRIAPFGTVFYEVLIDENAATHLALGQGYQYPVTDEADRPRVNKSAIHVDFVIGSVELAVDGITRNGDVIPVLRQGTWQI